MPRFWRGIRRAGYVAGVGSGVAAGIVVVIITFDVIARFVFDAPTVWTMEISSQLLLILSVGAMIYALLQKKHISVEIVFVRLPHRLQRWLRYAHLATIFLFSVFVTWTGADRTVHAFQRGYAYHEGVLWLPLWWTEMFLPLWGAFFILESLRQIHELCAGTSGEGSRG